MPSNSHFDSLFAMTALLNDAELHALADKCQNLIADRERIKREELRQELMANLQQTIGAILSNGFTLTIENSVNPDWIVLLHPEENCHIEIE